MTLNPGDAIRTVCEYQTLTRNESVHMNWGQNLLSEHCFAGLYVWPAENVKRGRTCMTNGAEDLCYRDLTCTRDEFTTSDSLVMKPILDKVSLTQGLFATRSV